MKIIVTGAAAAAALLVPGVALADQTGFVELAHQSANVEVGGIDVDGDAWSARATTGWMDGGAGIQLDGSYGEAEDELEAWNIGGHSIVRDEHAMFGAFLGYGQADFGIGHAGYWTGGVEAQWSMPRTTLDGAIVYSADDEDLDVSVVALELGATHFVTDQFSLGLDADFGSVDTPLGDAEGRRFGAAAEYQLPVAPISLFAHYSQLDVDDVDIEGDLVQVGVRYNWGGSLFERDRHGVVRRNAGGVALLGGL